MSHHRVIPRDLFNEANLLKMYGRLSLWAEDLTVPGLTVEHTTHAGEAFVVEQDESDGSLYVANLHVCVGGRHLTLRRPLNDRDPWTLYATVDGDDEFPVFTDEGAPSPDLDALAGIEVPA